MQERRYSLLFRRDIQWEQRDRVLGALFFVLCALNFALSSAAAESYAEQNLSPEKRKEQSPKPKQTSNTPAPVSLQHIP